MMKSFIVFAALIAFALAEVISDEEGNLYHLVPIRVRRQTTWGIEKNGPGATAHVQHQGTIFQNDKHHVTGSAFGSKSFPHGPLTVGGGARYNHIPSGSNVGVGVDHTPHFGTNVHADANVNLWRGNKGNTRLDAQGQYSKHFGGPWGNGRPNFGGGLTFTHRF
ncbi:attacin-A-like [Aethina tumida]|uniref:attacin-A-like n=1 Tax=Aethina tumida TaxID=116153 RepID=UPI00096B2305|nr:attacin-A-like [Aethina tumida]